MLKSTENYNGLDFFRKEMDKLTRYTEDFKEDIYVMAYMEKEYVTLNFSDMIKSYLYLNNMKYILIEKGEDGEIYLNFFSNVFKFKNGEEDRLVSLLGDTGDYLNNISVGSDDLWFYLDYLNYKYSSETKFHLSLNNLRYIEGEGKEDSISMCIFKLTK